MSKMLLQTLLAVLLACRAVARPAGQTVLALDRSPPHSLSRGSRDSDSCSFAPLLPPAIPLAVKSPYLNAWLSTGGEDGSKGFLAGSWPQHWPVRYAGSKRDHRLSWAGLIRIDNATFEFLGAPLSGDPSFADEQKSARQVAFEYTATRSIFSFEAAGVRFNATFLSPVTPEELVRQSLPFSYLTVDVSIEAASRHSIAVYTDISGEWASGENAELTWSYQNASHVGIHSVSRKEQVQFGESAEQAEWGQAVYATDLRAGVFAGTGHALSLRREFLQNGRLSSKHDTEYRKVQDRQPVFGFSVKLSESQPSATFSIGHIRNPYVNFVTPEGQLDLSGLWTTRHSHYTDALSCFQSSWSAAFDEARQFDEKVRHDARRASGDNYAALAELSVRQAFATFELTTGVSEDWKEDKNGLMAHLKEISSNGDMTTIDVIFPLHPLLLYTNPKLLSLLLEPLLRYTHSGLYPNRWPVHDLGRYPNATGYNEGNDEPMPVEEAGNMLWMALAYYQLTKDAVWVEKHYELFKQWTAFLLDDGLVPDEQLSTDDFAGTLSNQTNLAVKAIVGIGAMGRLAHALGRLTDQIHYRSAAEAFATEWQRMAITDKGGLRHAKLSYQDEDSWGTLYNLFGDRVLNLKLFIRDVYRNQSAWYRTQLEKYGLPLDSRHKWAKSDWAVFAAACAVDSHGRDLLIDPLVDYLKAGQVDAPLPDLYETPSAEFPGRGLDWPIYFIARPVVGGHFALLALEKLNKANGVNEDPFRG